MYYRIKDSLDAKILTDEIMAADSGMSVIADRIKEKVSILDNSYGTYRKSVDMGGYVLYFPNQQTYRENISEILKFYHINADDYEYSDEIGNGWHETLYLLSSDDGLVLIYPQGGRECLSRKCFVRENRDI